MDSTPCTHEDLTKLIQCDNGIIVCTRCAANSTHTNSLKTKLIEERDNPTCAHLKLHDALPNEPAIIKAAREVKS